MKSNRSAQNIETELFKIRIDQDVRLGQLMGVYLQLQLKASASSFRSIIWSLRHWLFPKRGYLHLLVLQNGGKHDAKQVGLIGLANLSDRFTSFIQGIVRSASYDFYITSGASNAGSGFDRIQRLKKSSRRLPWPVVTGIVGSNSLSVFEKIISLGVASIQWRAFITWKKHLRENRYTLVLADYDRYSGNAPMIMAARALGIPTLSLVHGATNPITNYVPVLAEHLLVWGEHHEELFRVHNKTSPEIHIVGNPKVHSYRRRGVEFRHIGLGMTRLPSSDRKKILNLFLAGTEAFSARSVKIHPQENVLDYGDFSATQNLEILGAEISVSQFLESIDVLCVRRSQLGSDALSYHIPIIICDGIDADDLQNGAVLAEQAGCPIVNTSRELSLEIERLRTDEDYYQSRLQLQEKYFRRLYAFVGHDSDQKVLEVLDKVRKK